MKILKKISTLIIALMAMFAVFVLTPQEVKAYNFNIRQIAQNETQVTVVWNAIPGATHYRVSDGVLYWDVRTNSTVIRTSASSGNAYGNEIYVKVTAYDANGDSIDYDYGYVYTMPKISNVTISNWQPYSNRCELYFNEDNECNPDGLNIQITDTKGRMLLNSHMYFSHYYTFVSSKIKNKGFVVRVQPFYNLSNSQIIYGPWTAWKEIVPQPKVSIVKKTYNYRTRRKSFVVRWRKLAGAKKYTVYRSVSSSSGPWRKIASTKGTAIKQKNLNMYKTYYYKVVANKVPVKVGGKTRKVNSTMDGRYYYSYIY